MSDSDDLMPYLRGRADRCSSCGYHPEAQGHDPECPLRDDPNATRPLQIPAVPPDPMTASRDPQPATSLTGVVGETIRTVTVPPKTPAPPTEEIECPW